MCCKCTCWTSAGYQYRETINSQREAIDRNALAFLCRICNSQKCHPVVTNISLQLCRQHGPVRSRPYSSPEPAGGYDSEASWCIVAMGRCPGPARPAICLGRASTALGRAGQGGVALPPSRRVESPFSGAATRNLVPLAALPRSAPQSVALPQQ